LNSLRFHLRIDLRSVPETGQAYDFRIGVEDWKPVESEDGILALNEPLQIHMEVRRTGNRFNLSGRLRGCVLLRCDRCLGEFPQEIDSEFQTFLSLPREENPPAERELQEEDLEVDEGSDEEMDVLEWVREQLLLDLPMKHLCLDDCRGLCVRCGRNLNQGPCACVSDEGHPAFQTLNTLKST